MILTCNNDSRKPRGRKFIVYCSTHEESEQEAKHVHALKILKTISYPLLLFFEGGEGGSLVGVGGASIYQ